MDITEYFVAWMVVTCVAVVGSIGMFCLNKVKTEKIENTI